jgi:NAD(P)-dependent dehydrogenase (short-subunit alcohol dehydrogenase family)
MASATLSSFPGGGLAVVVGASGGIGTAVNAQISASGAFAQTLAVGRSTTPAVDLLDEGSIAALANQAKETGHDLRLLFDATGYLHGPHGGPEKSWSAIDQDAMRHQFEINAIGPALLIKYFAPLVPRDGKAVLATISAKVGSISDNQLGGWYGYRAAKAALNQIVKTTSIELARKRREAACIALHPGTVATALSDPFAKKGVRLQTAQQSAAALLDVIDGVTPADSGKLLAYDGTTLPY